MNEASAVISRNGETLLGWGFWLPRQGNTVVLEDRLPMAPAVLPTYDLNLSDVPWAWSVGKRYNLDGDAIAISVEGERGYLLYTTVEGQRSMLFCRFGSSMSTVVKESRASMMEHATGIGIMAALAWVLVFESRTSPKKLPFFPPGEPLRDMALEMASVLYDNLVEHGGAHEHLIRKVGSSVLHSWIFPRWMIQEQLNPVRWFVRCALQGGKRRGRRHGRLPTDLEVPDWSAVDRDHLREVIARYQQNDEEAACSSE